MLIVADVYGIYQRNIFTNEEYRHRQFTFDFNKQSIYNFIWELHDFFDRTLDNNHFKIINEIVFESKKNKLKLIGDDLIIFLDGSSNYVDDKLAKFIKDSI